MAVLSDEDCLLLTEDLQRDFSIVRASIGITKDELRAAVNAANTWADANAGSYNTSLPQPARGTLTAKQKNYLLEYVLRRRREQS